MTEDTDGKETLSSTSRFGNRNRVNFLSGHVHETHQDNDKL